MTLIEPPQPAPAEATACTPLTGEGSVVPPTAPASAALPGRPRRFPSRGWIVVLAALVLATGAAAVGYLGWQDRAVSRPSQGSAAAPQPPAGQPGAFRLTEGEVRSLRIAPVALHEFRAERVAEGRIAYNEDRSTPVFPPYSGRVVRVLAAIGQTVAAGTPLFEIETNDLVQASNDLLAAVDAAAKARTTLDLARRNEQRQRDLFQARAAARRDWEQAQADAANAAADLRMAEAALAAARDRMRVLGRSPEQIAAVEATRRVDAVVAVVAPIGGTVVQRRIGPGQWLTGGAGDPAYVIADLSTMWLVAAVRELDAPLVRVGQEVEVTVNALPERRFSARITSIGAAIDPNTRRLSVRAEVQDPDGLLKPEMFASFRIVLGATRTSPAVPAGAVIHRGAETGVWVALPDGQSFAYRPVTLGMRSGSLWEVTAGLAAGERIVTGGALFIDRAAQVD